jgi:hypothetical protein
MKAYCFQKFEAIVYSQSRVVAARCAKAFAELPLDWVLPLESCLASDYLSRQRFDFVVIDLDAPEGPSILDLLISTRALHGAVFAITAGRVEAATLARCYDLQISYPTRPEEIIDELHRALPLAERLSAAASRPRPEGVSEGLLPSPEEELVGVGFGSAFLSQLKSKPMQWLDALFSMSHSFSVLAHERFACGMASVGAIWFVESLTQNFRGVASMGPPPPGPAEMIAISVLLWLSAKYRRILQNYLVEGSVCTSQ